MELRHNFTAHSGENANEYFVAYLGLEIATLEKFVQVENPRKLTPSQRHHLKLNLSGGWGQGRWIFQNGLLHEYRLAVFFPRLS